MSKKKKSPVMEAIDKASKETADDLEQHEPDDESFDFLGSTRKLSFKGKSDEEVAIDEMLVGLDSAQGWYLKLSKETAPNEWQFKKRIDHFKHWADLEYQINSIIRSETADEIKRSGRVMRWGTGRYMVTFFNDSGLRAEKRKPVFFNVDAQEPDNIQVTPTPDVTLMRDILTQQQHIDPNDVLKLTIESMQKGMEVASQREAKKESDEKSAMSIMMQAMQQQTTLMLGLITSMIGNKPNAPDATSQMSGILDILRTSGVLQPPKPEKPLLDTIKELQGLGVLKPPGDDDAVKSLEKVKLFMNLATDFAGAGAGERPSIIEKLIDTLGPKVPEMITNLSKTVGTVAEIQRNKMQLTPSQIQTPVRQLPVQAKDSNDMASYYGNDESEHEIETPMFLNEERVIPQSQSQSQRPAMTQEEEQAMQIKKFTNTLYQYVSTKDYSKFPEITQVLAQFLGGEQAVYAKVRSNSITPNTVLNYILMFDHEHYNTPQNVVLLQNYINEYLRTIRGNIQQQQQQTQPQQQELVITCASCGQEHAFSSEQDFLDEQKEMDGKVLCGMNGCENELTLE